MDWWLIPVGIAVLVMLRLLWVAAFHPGETVSAVPELDGYVPGGRSGSGSPDEPGHQAPSSGASSGAPSRTQSGESIHTEPEAPSDGRPGGTSYVADPGSIAESAADDEDGIWIELDIEPLFPSSDSSVTHLVDLTEEQDTEPRSS
jgi:hypothetical protein